jgi:hypothetical protein
MPATQGIHRRSANLPTLGSLTNNWHGNWGQVKPSYYAWKPKFGGMNVSDAQRLKALEAENSKLKRLLANLMLELDAMREVLHRK